MTDLVNTLKNAFADAEEEELENLVKALHKYDVNEGLTKFLQETPDENLDDWILL